MAGKLEQFKSNLEAFAANHKSKIAKDPIFRAQFNQMCRTIGVDPLQCAKTCIAAILVAMAQSFPCRSANSQEGILGFSQSW
jgi:hypothetical protein